MRGAPEPLTLAIPANYSLKSASPVAFAEHTP